LIWRSTGGVVFPDVSDLLEALFRRSEDGARPPFGEDIVLLSWFLTSAVVLAVGVMVVAGEIGELRGFCMSWVGVLSGPPWGGTFESWWSSESESKSLERTKGEGGMMVTFG
jgi:hypothetical protein